MPLQGFAGELPGLTHLARSMAWGGGTVGEIHAGLLNRAVGISSGDLLRIAETEVFRFGILERLGGQNWGQFGNVPARMGCPPGTTTIRVKATMTITDPETGRTRQFNHTATVVSPRNISAMMNEAAGQIVRHAREMGYQAADPGRLTSGNFQSLVIDYIDCG